MRRRTFWNDELNGHYALICDNEAINFYADKETYKVNDFESITASASHYIGGNLIDLLAEYEDTGLTPEEITRLKYVDIKKLQESNDILRKNNDEYFAKYQKLLDENNLLKQLLKKSLEKELGD